MEQKVDSQTENMQYGCTSGSALHCVCNILRSLSLPHNALFLSQRLSSSALPHGSSSYLLSFARPLQLYFICLQVHLCMTFELLFSCFFPPCGPIRYRILITTLCSCFELFCIDHFCPTSKSRRVEWLCNSKSCKAVQSMWKIVNLCNT